MLVDFEALLSEMADRTGDGSVPSISPEFTRQVIEEEMAPMLLLLKLYDHHLEKAIEDRLQEHN